MVEAAKIGIFICIFFMILTGIIVRNKCYRKLCSY